MNSLLTLETKYAPTKIRAEPMSCMIGAGSLKAIIPTKREIIGDMRRRVDAFETFMSFKLQYQKRTYPNRTTVEMPMFVSCCALRLKITSYLPSNTANAKSMTPPKNILTKETKKLF